MALVVAVVGMPGCGKGESAAVVSAAGLPVFSMGDMIRAEVESRGLEGDPMVFGRVAQELRDEFGYGVLAERLAPLVDAATKEHPLVLIEGMRGTDERDVFLEHWTDGFRVVAIVADADVRFRRISSRGRAEDGDRLSFDARDQRESTWGVSELMVLADWRLDNSSDLDTFKNVSETWLKTVLPSD